MANYEARCSDRRWPLAVIEKTGTDPDFGTTRAINPERVLHPTPPRRSRAAFRRG
jgi:hypothetical protein